MLVAALTRASSRATTPKNSKARANTFDNNGECGSLRVKLKYIRHSDGSVVDMPWLEGQPSENTVTRNAPANSNEQASQHRAYHPFTSTWSTIRQPHAY